VGGGERSWGWGGGGGERGGRKEGFGWVERERGSGEDEKEVGEV